MGRSLPRLSATHRGFASLAGLARTPIGQDNLSVHALFSRGISIVSNGGSSKTNG